MSRCYLIFIYVHLCFLGYISGSSAIETVADLTAYGHDSRIDLIWQAAKEGDVTGYNIYRSGTANGSFEKINEKIHKFNIYSDFIGTNNVQYYYRVHLVARDGSETGSSDVSSAATMAMSDDQLLRSVQEATLRYFWEYGHPVSGLARERNGGGNVCAIGGTGFGMIAIMVGVDHGILDRGAAAERLVGMLRFLDERAERYHGAWSHWVNGRTGETIPFSQYDDGADIVETAYLVQGMLTIRQYFDGNNSVETELRERASRLWREVEWSWFLGEDGGSRLYWHWSRKYGWKKHLLIGGRYNECMITYILAIASPDYPIPPDYYYKGWCGEPPRGYLNGRTYYGHKQWVGRPKGGPLFFTHYSFIGFDPRNKSDRYCDYFENNRNISLIHRAYCIENPGRHKDYSGLVWGLTSCDGPEGYGAFDPQNDTGTIAPTAAISAMPYVPKESIATLRHYYSAYGSRLWGEFGFRDSFNLDKDWFSTTYLAIDQGPIVCMIENYRTGLCWRMFMSNPEVSRMLQLTGWKVMGLIPGE